MKIAVLGASGKTGQAFVAVAVAAGHTVTAGVRSTNPFRNQPDIRVMTCDVSNEQQVSSIIRGQDAIVSLLGHVRGTPANMQTDAMGLITKCMDEAGVRRLVSLTGSGARCPGDTVSLVDRLMNLGISLVDPQRIADGASHIRALEASNVEWTVVRVLKLTNLKAGAFSLTPGGPAKTFISRASVAQAILDILNEDLFIKQCPVISR